MDLLALWLLGQPAPPDEVYDRLDRLRPGSAVQVRYLHRAVHEPPPDLDPEALTGTIRSLILWLAEV